MIRIWTGHEAIEYATKHNLTLGKYADPIEDARTGLSVREAREIAAENPSLIFVWVDEFAKMEELDKMEGA